LESYQSAGPGGSLAPTLYDVPREAGVSAATVSRLVHGQDRVRPATRRRVLEAFGVLGYDPYGAARSVAQRREEVIGLIAVESCAPPADAEREGFLFIEEVLRGVERPLGNLGWSVLISFVRAADLAGAYQRMQKVSAQVDGLIYGSRRTSPWPASTTSGPAPCWRRH
jgi:LacI family transcriptional regulator